MAAQIPVKAIYSGSDVTSLGEFTASDDITITYLPTGTSSSTVALGDHTHAYLPLAGGALTGNLTTDSLIDGRDVAADGVLATNAMPKAGGAFTGAVTTNSTIDTVDIAVRDGVLTTTTTTANAALPKAGGTMTGNLTMGANEILLSDNGQIQLGDSQDMLIYHDASHSCIQDNGTGNLTLKSNGAGINFQKGDSETMCAMATDGAVTLYHNNVAKVATTANGLTVTGTAVATTDTDTSNSGSITLDFATNQNFVLTLTGNVTLANPTTEQVGQSGFIAFIQDGTGSRTVALGTDYETAAAAGLTLTTTASATDLVPYLVVASGRILLGTPQLAFA